jgi:hypothetical protein
MLVAQLVKNFPEPLEREDYYYINKVPALNPALVWPSVFVQVWIVLFNI